MEGLSQVTSAGWEPGSSMAVAGPLEVNSPLHRVTERRSTGWPMLLARGTARSWVQGRPPGLLEGADLARTWQGGPGRGLAWETLSRGYKIPAQQFPHNRLWSASTLLFLWNSGQTVHSCPRGNGFSLNLQFFLLNRQPVFQGLFSVLRNCTRRAPSRALTSGSSLKLLLCSYPGPCPLHPAWPHGGPI